jgi:hypothetical protein
MFLCAPILTVPRRPTVNSKLFLIDPKTTTTTEAALTLELVVDADADEAADADAGDQAAQQKVFFAKQDGRPLGRLGEDNTHTVGSIRIAGPPPPSHRAWTAREGTTRTAAHPPERRRR